MEAFKLVIFSFEEVVKIDLFQGPSSFNLTDKVNLRNNADIFTNSGSSIDSTNKLTIRGVFNL